MKQNLLLGIVLRSWENPDLGPSTTIQILDEADAPEKVTFGNIK